MKEKQSSILILYTGGTIGMVNDPETGSLVPFDFDRILKQVPELKEFDYHLNSIAFTPPIDSSNLNPDIWVEIAKLIEKNYEEYDGFVILHGTDTMSYTASALSFMFNNLEKPIVLTGSQLPIGILRTDGKENLITAIEIAAACENGKAVVPEVCIVFENRLFRGNRTTKHNAEYFNAFYSHNYPDLAKIGININYNYSAIRYPEVQKKMQLNTKLDKNIAILKIFPGITKEVVDSILNIAGLRGVLLESYGSGNAPTDDWFIESIKNAVKKGMIIYNVTQCASGSVKMDLYETGLSLLNAGVIGGFDITTEAAIGKLMFVLGQSLDQEQCKISLKKSLKGELSQ